MSISRSMISRSVSDRIPLLADLKPSGKYVQEELHAVGGTPAVMKLLLAEGLIDGSCLTVTGKTIAENLADLPGLKAGQDVVQPLSNPIKKTGHIRIMRGNFCPDGAVAKITGKEGLQFTGPAKVFDSEEDMLHALEQKKINKGDVVIIRYEGPQGGPGMPEMLTPTSAIVGAGLGQRCGPADRWPVQRRFARFYRGTRHARSASRRTHRARENRRQDHHRRREEHDRRRYQCRRIRQAAVLPGKPQRTKSTRGTLYKYIKNVKSASEGCVTDE